MDTIQAVYTVQVVDTVQMVNNYIQSGDMDISTLMTVIIAVIALVFSIWQGFVTRIHNKLSVKPHIDIYITDEPGITIENNGIGPALIESFDIYLENIKLPNSLKSSDYSQINFKLGFNKHTVLYKFYKEDNSMKAGDSIIAVNIVDDLDPPSAEYHRIRNILNNAKIEIKYKSIYGERFTAYKSN